MFKKAIIMSGGGMTTASAPNAAPVLAPAVPGAGGMAVLHR